MSAPLFKNNYFNVIYLQDKRAILHVSQSVFMTILLHNLLNREKHFHQYVTCQGDSLITLPFCRTNLDTMLSFLQSLFKRKQTTLDHRKFQVLYLEGITTIKLDSETLVLFSSEKIFFY